LFSRLFSSLIWAVACVGVSEVGVRSASTRTQEPVNGSTALYTSDQAGRGAEHYARVCTHCHRADLSGNEDGAPPMKGPAFENRWNNRPLSELHFVIKETMPQDGPGALSDKECSDIVAYILKSNGLPSGVRELPADSQALSGIRMHGPISR
jgi:mono/diheme cytochrome c family protein